MAPSRHYRELAALSAPIAGIQFAQIALTSTDLVMIGGLGLDALAAGGLAALLYNQFRTMCVGMVTGLGNLVATAMGRSEQRTQTSTLDASARDDIRDLVRAALFLATVAALLCAGLLVGISECLVALGQDVAVAAMARPMMIALAPGLLPMVWLNVLRQFAVGLRRPGSLFRVTLVSVGVNALLNAIFLYGWLGLPRLGIAGVGLATTLVQAWSLLVYWRAIRREAALQGLLSLTFWKARPRTILAIAKMGAPISITYGLEASVTSVASLLIGHFGPVVLAASNVVNQLAKIVYQINVGLSHGASILVSRALGRQAFAEIGVIARAAMTICLVLMMAIGLVYVLVPRVVLWPFLGPDADPATLSVATTLLWFAVVNQLFAASQNICIGLLRGLGNTRAGLTLTFVGYGLIGMPAVVICSVGLGWEGEGVWLGLCMAFGASSVLLWRRFVADLARMPRAGASTASPAKP